MVDPLARPANYTSGGEAPPRRELAVEPALAGLRLDQALARLLPGESRSRLARLVEEGSVLVDGDRARPADRLRGGERLVVTLAPRPGQEAFRPEDIALDVLHEDEDGRNLSACIARGTPVGPHPSSSSGKATERPARRDYRGSCGTGIG